MSTIVNDLAAQLDAENVSETRSAIQRQREATARWICKELTNEGLQGNTVGEVLQSAQDLVRERNKYRTALEEIHRMTDGYRAARKLMDLNAIARKALDC